MAGMFLAALDQSIVAVALPKITSELGGLDKLSWVVTAYLLTSTAATPLWGKISDLRGRRPMFQAAIVVFLIGSLICGFCSRDRRLPQRPGINVMIAGRAVQGLGAGGLMSLALAVIGDIIPPRERGQVPGILRRRVRGLLGRRSAAWRLVHRQPGLGVDLLHQHPDRYCCAGRHLIGTQAASRTPPGLGRLPRRGDHRWLGDQPRAVPQLGRSGQGLDVSDRHLAAGEHRAYWPRSSCWSSPGPRSRSSRLELFKHWTFTSNIIFAMIMGIGMFGGLIFLPIYLQAVKGMSATQSGLAILPLVVGIFTTSIGGGQIMARTGRYKWMPITGALVVGCSALRLLDAPGRYPLLHRGVDHVRVRHGPWLHDAGSGHRRTEQRRSAKHGCGHRICDVLPFDGRLPSAPRCSARS